MRVAALLAMTAISMFAQKPDTGQSVRGADDNATKPERPGGSAPPIKVTARLVVLNVLVQDHSGHPVSGLCPTRCCPKHRSFRPFWRFSVIV